MTMSERAGFALFVGTITVGLPALIAACLLIAG